MKHVNIGLAKMMTQQFKLLIFPSYDVKKSKSFIIYNWLKLSLTFYRRKDTLFGGILHSHQIILVCHLFKLKITDADLKKHAQSVDLNICKLFPLEFILSSD